MLNDPIYRREFLGKLGVGSLGVTAGRTAAADQPQDAKKYEAAPLENPPFTGAVVG